MEHISRLSKVAQSRVIRFSALSKTLSRDGNSPRKTSNDLSSRSLYEFGMNSNWIQIIFYKPNGGDCVILQ